jgi:hypothetical protein
MRWPALRVGEFVKFSNGRFTATKQSEVDAIEKCESYNVHIHPLLLDKPRPAPVKPGPVETMIESEIEAALAERQPQARRGGIGTKSASGNKR